MKASWGLATTGEPKYCWGARAIWTNRVIDIPYDRCGWEGESTLEERKALGAWVGVEGMKLLEKKLNEEHVAGSDEVRVEVSGKGFLLSANPHGSYGYLYLVCEPEEK